MNKNANNRRSRGRGGNKRHGNIRNQTFESNGPGVKVRGTAQQVLDKYLALARDASSSGDRIVAESYFQFAEHYFRLLNTEEQRNAERNGMQRRPGERDRFSTPAGADGAMDEAGDEMDGDDDGDDGEDYEAGLQRVIRAAPMPSRPTDDSDDGDDEASVDRGHGGNGGGQATVQANLDFQPQPSPQAAAETTGPDGGGDAPTRPPRRRRRPQGDNASAPAPTADAGVDNAAD